MMKLFLLVAGVFLIPVALSYGVDPAATLPKFMNITVEGTDQAHIFRALMGLYLGMVAFCIIAAFTPEWQHVAVIWAVFSWVRGGCSCLRASVADRQQGDSL